jgi:type I restriction enzyme S subunit
MEGDDWKVRRLGDLIEARHGWPFKSEFFDEDLTGRPIVVSVGNFRYTGGFRFDETSIKEYRSTYPGEYELAPGDILLVMTCQTPGGEILGIPARVPGDGRIYLHNQRLGKVVIRPDAPIDSGYLYWLFLWQEFNREIVSTASGTKILHTAPSRIEAFRFALPPLREQRAIAHILGTLDDKIELNRRMNETQEAIARALFTERAREEDWDEYPLGDLCTIYDGPHATPKLVEHGPIFLGISNLTNGLLDLSETAHVTDEDFAKWTRRVTPSAGDVVFSYETRLGQAAIIPEGLKCCLGRRMGLLRPKDGRATGFVLLQAYLAAEFQETIRQRTIHGSTVDRIPLKEMGAFPIRLPEGEARQQLAALLLPMRSRVEHNQRESHTLAALRDALMPKLISGELRVKDAERQLEAAL